MNNYAFAGQVAAPLAIGLGILICFWGYRILKVALAITGFVIGVAGGWAAGIAMAPGQNGIALACALAGGVLGAILCVWFFYLGVFLVGVSAGTVVAAAVFGGTGHHVAPLVPLAIAIAFGVVAVLLQKFMIVVSTAFTGSYLIISGIMQVSKLGTSGVPLWFDQLKSGSATTLGYAALGAWLVVALIGMRFQYKSGRRPAEAPPQGSKPA